MREYTGPFANNLKTASLVMQPAFADQFKKFDRIQLKSAIDSFLLQEPSTPLIRRIWLKCLKMRFVPLAFSRMMILNMLRARSSKWLKQLPRQERRWLENKARKKARKLKIG